MFGASGKTRLSSADTHIVVCGEFVSGSTFTGYHLSRASFPYSFGSVTPATQNGATIRGIYRQDNTALQLFFNGDVSASPPFSIIEIGGIQRADGDEIFGGYQASEDVTFWTFDGTDLSSVMTDGAVVPVNFID